MLKLRQPCSGKSKAGLCLVEALKESWSNQTVRVNDEASCHLDRNQSYANMPAGKNLRGVLRSKVDRSMSKDNTIIVDSLNNIKGYMYELWCLARAAGIRYCVLNCDADETHCRKWKEERREKDEDAYDDKVFEDLVRRFETLDRRNRWDSPLFELWPRREGGDNAIVEAQSQALVGPLNGVSVGLGAPINISRSIGLPELCRLRQTFIKLIGKTSLSGRLLPSDANSAKRMFVDYLNRELENA
ncbi:hypothetical protein M0R45_020209 [Rubus argutus]|uniref:Uncharacterized protein n=1 Tax=Rubus argutus TaxID=59490 RepID=A0AAW1X9H4_RUBAR